MTQLQNGFLWGAATAPMQVEGNNINSDWWQRESTTPGMQPSGDALDSYHRYREDMQLLADNGYNSYRFGIEWSRIEPRPGQFSRAELAHYRRMIDTALELGLKPVVTLHHFTSPAWFAAEGGWFGDAAIDRFAAYVEKACTILHGVEWVVTMNEPNMLALMGVVAEAMKSGEVAGWQSPTIEGEQPDHGSMLASMPSPRREHAQRFIDAHHAVRNIVRERTGAKVGWSIANQALTSAPGGEQKLLELRYIGEDIYLDASKGDDFVGVQSYSSQEVNADGLVPHPQLPDNTQVGTAYRPDALGLAVRHTWQHTGLPILVTENGIATADDQQRISYTTGALKGLFAAMDDGADVHGYLHWSLLDNYEWGHWEPTFGLIAVGRETFERKPKPSLAWLGGIARRNGADIG
ncbi:family 1 glycosylhydrolase [Arthrobacter sp. TMT4-20]